MPEVNTYLISSQANMKYGDPNHQECLFIICVKNGQSNFATVAYIDFARTKHTNIF